MTDDNKKTPTDDKITELSAWQKRNKEYLEKKALEKAEEAESEEAQEDEDLSEKETASVSEEGSDERKESEEENESEGEEDPEADRESSEEEDDPAVEELDPSEKQEKKPSFFKRLKTKKPKKEPTVAKRHIYRALPVIGISSIVALLSIYFLSPLSTQKVIEFSGNKAVDQQLLYEKSRIKEEDYTLTTFLHKSVYEQNMKTASPWIKEVHMHYQFPVTFKVNVVEHKVVAYYVTGEDHYPVLENGEVVETVTPASELPSSYISLKFSDRELVRQFVQEMKSISSSITDKIVSVDLTPSKVTKDLVTITMKNDNKILVPVSQITRKLPYYKAISKQLDDASTIDMEAGVFSYSEQSIADAKEQAEKEKAESTENQDEHSEEASQEQNQEQNPEGENSSGNG
ncbi:cell division protein FtsQ/DivIB [Streptococcus sp. HMSC072G04]|uniref:cell division protein FtsQ/DivIB n=1 Tax=Streptococcus TaxID=1301 RepID=UPI0008A1BF16|nr:FtsQ-type POTRA domain-containing protein [Streptococcus sp. HMSC072G04]OFR13804.1 cell division protein FtsQ [Streptococcus sp. HMSC072G04]